MILKFRGFRVEVGRNYCLTKFDDGTQLYARPNYGSEHVARAKALGYETVEQMTREHDLLHALLAEARGWWHSNVVWNTAHGLDVGPGGEDEERIVMLMAALRNGKYDDILKEHQ